MYRSLLLRAGQRRARNPHALRKTVHFAVPMRRRAPKQLAPGREDFLGTLAVEAETKTMGA